MAETRQLKVLAVASSGGHWIELLRLVSVLAEYQVVFVTPVSPAREEVGAARVHVIGDANRWTKLAMIGLVGKLASIVVRERPDVVLSTGAAPGCISLCLGKLLGARTIWVDSIANAEHLSLSGRLVGTFADLWLTQWPHLAKPRGPAYGGKVF